ncbi:acyl-CoA synthetase [Parafrankia colletiae]|uniref:Acyl-CoA synthetase n=1 Tax=Parafrankia colletiae TaxID=573497 RepID=A0A1S1R2Z1_9ACTN|nr:acyl-CoA synthetase [Parafrankia colletiae]MCK9900218.1 acyl-CoA synthetase [Frankia sp. Cpl3]OHV40266.1 acyl-CoA synthetase [Parafrankia colletiae]
MDIDHPRRFAASAPERPAVIIGDRILSYGELERRSNQVAHALRSSGLGVGSHLAVLMENRTEYFEVVWAALRAGLLVTPINWHLSAAEAGYIVADCGAAALVVSAARADVAAGIDAPALKVRLAVGGPVDGFDAYEEVVGAQPVSPVDDECEGNWMFYSSGTTGRPKGIAPASVGGPIGAADSFTGMVRFLYGGDESTRYLSPAPLYHAAPLAWATAVHRLGGTVIATERFDALEFLRLVERHRVTLSQVVPTHLVRLLKLPEADRARFDLSSLRTLVHAAAPCPPAVKRAVLDWLGPIVHEYYSGSEGVGFCAIGPEEWLAHPGSVGRSLLAPVHIVGEDGGEVPPRIEGRVYFEVARPFAYHGDPEKTAGAFDERGWGTFGEVGWVDEDGYLYLTDRVSSMIISGGVNVYPREVEDVLILHPAVTDVVVIGVPDAEMGESVRAVVQPAQPPADPGALASELIAFARERVAHYKCPRSVVFLAELPRLLTGKVARRLLPPEATS